MKKFVCIVTLLLTSFATQAAGVGNFFGALMGRSGSFGNESNMDDTLVKLSAQINKKMPVAVDADTRLDKVSAGPGQHFIYHYTLVSVRSSDVDMVAFRRQIEPQLKNRLCDSTEMKSFLKNGVTISYLYRGNDGRPIGGAKFTPGECDQIG